MRFREIAVWITFFILNAISFVVQQKPESLADNYVNVALWLGLFSLLSGLAAIFAASRKGITIAIVALVLALSQRGTLIMLFAITTWMIRGFAP